MGDPDVLELLGSLQESSLMDEVLADPELMAKVHAGDLAALSEDPWSERLARDSRVREIRRRVDP